MRTSPLANARRTAAVAALLLVSLTARAQSTSAAAGLPFQPKVEQLSNGLTVVRIPFNSPGLVAYYSVVRVGSRNEVEVGHTGFAHFFEHMMFKGTKRFPEGVRDRALAQAGWNENAFTTDDITVYHLVGPSTQLGALIDYEADRFQNLEYSEPAFQTEAKAVLGEYHKSAASPELKMEEALLGAAFTRHTYQHTTLGFYEDIQQMPSRYEYSKQFFQRWYTPDNLQLFIVGDFDDAKTMANIKKAYGSWDRKVATVEIPVEPPQTNQRLVEVPWKESTLPRLMYAWHTPAARLDTLDSAIQRVLEDYLVGPTSDVHRELVLEKQVAEGVGSWFFPHRDPYLFSIAATLKDEKHRTLARKAFDNAIKKIVAGKIDAKRVDAIKSNARYSLLMRLETPSAVAGAYSTQAGIYGDPLALERQIASLAEITPSHLQEFVKKHFVAKNRTVLDLFVDTKSASKGGKR